MDFGKICIRVLLTTFLVGSCFLQIIYAGEKCEHDMDYCSNGDGTHYVYCTEAKCHYERTEDCVDLKGRCPYCGFVFTEDEEDIRDKEEASTENRTEEEKETVVAAVSGAEQSDTTDKDEQGIESTNIVSLALSDGITGTDGSIVTDWYRFEPYELIILAQIMRHEAGNQPEAGQIGVVEVILNRMASPYFSQNTVSGIVYAPKQFSYASNSKTIVPTESELSLVRDVILGYKRVFNNPNILYFRNTMITSGFPTSLAIDWGSHKYATYIKDHAFYYQ